MTRIYLNQNNQQPVQPQGTGRIYLKDRAIQQPQVQQPQNNWSSQHPVLNFLKNMGVGMYEGARNAGAAIADVGLRTSPLEGIRDIAGGIANIKKPGGFQQGVLNAQARPLLWEKATGQNALENPRGFIGSAMSAPTYFAPIAGAGKEIAGNLGTRLLTRTAQQLPVAGINTGLQQFEQGNLKDVIPHFAGNTLLMGLLANAGGEFGKLKGNVQKGVQKLEPVTPKSSNQKMPQPEYPTSVPEANSNVSSKSSYTPNTTTPAKNVNPLIQEAGKGIKMTEEQYLASKGAGSDFGDAGLHMSSQRISKKSWSKTVGNQVKKDEELFNKRDALRQEYRDKVSSGDIIQPTRNEKLIETANGNPDNESVKAARRLLEKKGISWKSQSPQEGVNPLIQEAKKYRSAEEFVGFTDNRGKIFKGLKKEEIKTSAPWRWEYEGIDGKTYAGHETSQVTAIEKIKSKFTNPPKREMINPPGGAGNYIPSEDTFKLAIDVNRMEVGLPPLYGTKLPKSQPLQEGVNPLIQEARKWKLDTSDVSSFKRPNAVNKRYTTDLADRNRALITYDSNTKRYYPTLIDSSGKQTRLLEDGVSDYRLSKGFKTIDEAKSKFSQPLQEGGIDILRKEVQKYDNANDFTKAMWNKLNREKKPIPGFEKFSKEGSVRDANAAISKELGQLDENGLPQKGWFDSFADFYKKNKSQKVSLQEGGKIRGHITTTAESPETSMALYQKLNENPETITTRHQKPLVEEAQKLIFNNPLEAERIAKSEISDRSTIIGDELVKHYDIIAQKARANGDMATFNQAMDKAVGIVKESAPNLTEAGRAISAANQINKLSPSGIIKYVNDVVRKSGSDLKLSNEKVFDFSRKAENINQILDPREKAFATFDLIDELVASLPKSGRDKVLEALNLPRAMMATADLSFPLRQGLFAGTRHPIRFAKQIGQMFKYAFSEDAYRGLKADIITDPNYHLMVKYKLPLTDISAGLTGREERFMSQLSEKIPGFGKLARGSDRAYTGMANLMRKDLFNDFVKTGQAMGIKDEKFLMDAAKFTGSATGRGSLPKFLENTQELLNGALFSPRLIASRMNLLNPLYYAKLHPVVRKEALKTLASFVGTGTAVLTLAKLNGAEVGTDWRSADFGKIKIGNTRFDVWGGFQQYARLIGQEITGQKISTITGRQTTLGQGYQAPTRWSIAQDFIESKEAPLMSFISTISKGNQFGEKLNIPKEVIDRFIPMVISDMYDLYKEKGWPGVPMAVPGAFGIGSQTYGDQIPMLNKTPAGNPSVQFRSQPSLGEDILNKITGKSVSNIPQDQWKPLYAERLAEQKRQVEIDAAKQDVLNTGQPKYVGDTFIFLDNGIVKTKVIAPTPRTPLKKELLKQPFYTP